jgi:hypothetical protein
VLVALGVLQGKHIVPFVRTYSTSFSLNKISVVFIVMTSYFLL